MARERLFLAREGNFLQKYLRSTAVDYSDVSYFKTFYKGNSRLRMFTELYYFETFYIGNSILFGSDVHQWGNID